jgi:hypothetical protein
MFITTQFSGTALCCKLKDVNPEWFFSEDEEEIEIAQTICSFCPIKKECLEWANLFEKDEKYRWGVYGGLTSLERQMLA